MRQEKETMEQRGVGRFVARDPYRPTQTLKEVDELLQEMDGVLDWTIHPDGQVTVEYDPDRITDALIEDSLDGVGLELEHISDRTVTAETAQVLDQ
jgi:hypothetical protein